MSDTVSEMPSQEERRRNRGVPLGFVLVLGALCFNEWTLAQVLIPDRDFDLATGVLIGTIDLVLLISGAVLWYLRVRVAVRVLLFNIALLLFLLSLIEGALLLLMKHPGSIPRGVPLRIMREIYVFNRDFIQYNRDCAQYDESLAYLLRPGSHGFSNEEFSTQIHVNRLGFRDDAGSLVAPEIIVLGDSHAMGWGVEQDDTFAEILEREGEGRVLNAAMSSFGTAREILALERLDTSGLRTLVIQYCPNDFTENEVFSKNNHHLPIMSRQEYAEVVRTYERAKTYYFGKYTLRFVHGGLIQPVRMVTRKLAEETQATTAPRSKLHEAETFLDVLLHSGLDLRGIDIIVLEINGHGQNDSDFVQQVEQAIASGGDRYATLKVSTIDVSKILEREHYYRLDDHMNAAGHRLVAEAISSRLSELRSRPKSP